MATPFSVPSATPSFDEIFEALTGNGPYRWQEKLFRKFLGKDLPPDINLPTGSGKTSIMAIWLTALAQQASQQAGEISIPRRLVWVVDRRVVVDQATDEAEQMRERLMRTEPNRVIEWLRSTLSRIGGDTGQVLAVSTLRGEREDNGEWSEAPCRPAVIVGTVDMIGSRLLFSGYGDSRYWRPHHAGLLGQDALVVNDEAHLTPAFAQLLNIIESANKSTLRPFRSIRLSATHAEDKCWPESLEADEAHSYFKKIYEAKKRLHVQVHPAAKLESVMVELATQRGSGRTILFVTEPGKAQKLATAIKKKVGVEAAERVLTLTGTMRGFERDELVKKEEFKPFTSRVRSLEDHWLVATSAGEVGVNISADQLITGLDTLDHLIQRFGRLNRFGETDGVAYLVSAEKEKDEKSAALRFLRKELEGNDDDGYDISPKALFGLALDEKACTAFPLFAPLHPWHIDVLSQTSPRSHPSRPNVAPWLHGRQDNLPDTFIAWREDVRILADEVHVDDDDREEVLEKYRLLGHEQLHEPTHKIVEKLGILFSGTDRIVPVLRRRSDGTVDVVNLPLINTRGTTIDIRTNPEPAKAELAYCQLILPAGCGRPQNGMFEPEWPSESGPRQAENEPDRSQTPDAAPYDVSGTPVQKRDDGSTTETRASFVATQQEDGGWSLKRMGGIPGKEYPLEFLIDLERPRVNEFAAKNGWRFLLEVRPEYENGDSGPNRRLLYFGPGNRRKTNPKEILFVDQHDSDVAKLAAGIASRLGLPQECALALEAGGNLHDLGKKQDIWQKAAGNWDFKEGRLKNEAVAKPIVIMRGRQLGGFRHEFASLRQAKEHLATEKPTSEVCELALHLIAAHHGHGRPCFESKAYDRAQPWEREEERALETAKRFAQLQRRYGSWGLAYLESILRAADGASSQIAQEQPTNG